MFAVDKRQNVAIILLLAMPVGCRTAVPLDRDVQISQHLGGHQSSEQPPPTRLASADALASTGAPAHHRLSDSEPGEDTEVVAAAGAKPATTEPRVAAQKHASAQLSDSAEPNPGLTAESAVDADAEAEFSELVAAFRDSSPEVQQQTVRQLIAAISHRASKTDQPSDIDEQLKRSLAALPILPDETQESEGSPIRLAATSPAGSADTDAPSSDSVAESEPVSQAAVASADSQPQVAPVSGTTSGGEASEPLLKVKAQSPGHSEQETLKAVADTALYSELVMRLDTPQAGESDAQRLRREIIARHLQVLAGDPDSAVQSLDGLAGPQQEFLRQSLLALASMTDEQGHPVASRRFATALPQFRSAVRHLAEATEQLDVRSLAFCTEILSFGQVKRFTSNRFEAGQQVILYCEVDNFVAEKSDDGYETELQGSYEIFDSEGTKVAGQVLPADRQLCDHYLRDYFIAYQMHLPSQLPPGDYRLELSMECVKGRKYGQSALPLVIKK